MIRRKSSPPSSPLRLPWNGFGCGPKREYGSTVGSLPDLAPGHTHPMTATIEGRGFPVESLDQHLEGCERPGRACGRPARTDQGPRPDRRGGSRVRTANPAFRTRNEPPQWNGPRSSGPPGSGRPPDRFLDELDGVGHCRKGPATCCPANGRPGRDHGVASGGNRLVGLDRYRWRRITGRVGARLLQRNWARLLHGVMVVPSTPWQPGLRLVPGRRRGRHRRRLAWWPSGLQLRRRSRHQRLRDRSPAVGSCRRRGPARRIFGQGNGRWSSFGCFPDGSGPPGVG